MMELVRSTEVLGLVTDWNAYQGLQQVKLATVEAFQMLDSLHHLRSKDVRKVLAQCETLDQVAGAAVAFAQLRSEQTINLKLFKHVQT